MEHNYTIEEIKARLDIVQVAQQYGMQLKKQGVEYNSLCCFHQEKTPSLQFTPSNQLYHCKGCGAGGDVFTFIKDCENLDSNSDVVNRMKELAGIIDDQGKPTSMPVKKVIERPADPSDDWQPVLPVPDSAPKLKAPFGNKTTPVYNPNTDKFHEWEFEPEGIYVYRDGQNRALGAVLRAFINSKKMTPTITYCTNKHTGEQRWCLKGFPEPKPLYIPGGLMHDLPVMLVEGERCADSANIQLNKEYCSVTWPNGTNAIDKVDWSPLYGKEIVQWADHDLKEYTRGAKKGQIKPAEEQSGRRAMLWVKKHLEANGSEVKLLDQPEGKPDGWDCADAVEEGYSLTQYIEDHIPIETQEEYQEEDDQPALSRSESDIIPLGYYQSRFYYFSKPNAQIKMLRDKEHTQNSLLGLAPVEFWKTGFNNGKDGVDWTEATSWMMQSCRLVGIYSNDKVRGRGCWIDGERIVLHLGDRLLVDNETVQLTSFKSQYVYQAEKRLPAPKKPLNDREAKALLDTARRFAWEMPASALLLSGFCVLAPICSALEWRPHLWLTGASGTGKSTVYDKYIKPLIGPMGIYTALESTQAGLTQTLNTDGLPVIFEEFDPSRKKKTDMDKAQGFFNLMRLASNDNGIGIYKGSATGEASEFNINSMFCLVGIQVCTTEPAILNRTTQLAVKSRRNVTNEEKEENNKQWAELQDILYKNIEGVEHLSERLLARTIANLPTIRKNIKVFRKAATTHFGYARYADQYGTLLAGAYSLVSDAEIKEEMALEYIKRYDWNVYIEDTEDDDSRNALNSILQVPMQVEADGLPKKMTVIEAIKEVRDATHLKHEAAKELARFGILCNNSGIIIANKSDRIERELKGKMYDENWGKQIKRIVGPNGERPRGTTNAKSFNGIASRGTEVPYSIVF